MHTAVEVQNLNKSYGKTQILHDLSFSIHSGEIFGLLGPNGAGKTTTLNIIEGLKQADSGTIRVLGMDTVTHSRTIKSRIGIQLQSTSLMPDLTVVEQVLLFGQLYNIAINHKQAMQLLERFELVPKANALPEKLSGGQQQRLALAIALVNDPEILFLDEPTTGLDPQARRNLWEVVRGLRDEGRTIVLTTHYMEEAESLAHRVGIIDNGKLLALDTPGELIAQLNNVTAITIPDSFAHQQLLDLPAVQDIRVEGGMTTLYTRDVQTTNNALMNLAQQMQVVLRDLRIQPPNLEDVFIQLTGRSLRDV